MGARITTPYLPRPSIRIYRTIRTINACQPTVVLRINVLTDLTVPCEAMRITQRTYHHAAPSHSFLPKSTPIDFLAHAPTALSIPSAPN